VFYAKIYFQSFLFDRNQKTFSFVLKNHWEWKQKRRQLKFVVLLLSAPITILKKIIISILKTNSILILWRVRKQHKKIQEKTSTNVQLLGGWKFHNVRKAYKFVVAVIWLTQNLISVVSYVASYWAYWLSSVTSSKVMRRIDKILKLKSNFKAMKLNEKIS
jgi:hypothetical protein